MRTLSVGCYYQNIIFEYFKWEDTDFIQDWIFACNTSNKGLDSINCYWDQCEKTEALCLLLSLQRLFFHTLGREIFFFVPQTYSVCSEGSVHLVKCDRCCQLQVQCRKAASRPPPNSDLGFTSIKLWWGPLRLTPDVKPIHCAYLKLVKVPPLRCPSLCTVDSVAAKMVISFLPYRLVGWKW